MIAACQSPDSALGELVSMCFARGNSKKSNSNKKIALLIFIQSIFLSIKKPAQKSAGFGK